MRKKFFMMRVVRRTRLPREVVDASSMEVFEVRLIRTLSNQI